MQIDFEKALREQIVDKRIDILRRIEQLGSISEAARSAKISYKAAWQALEMLSEAVGGPVVEKAVGGAKGGGAKITELGRSLLTAAAALSKVKAQLADKDILSDQNKFSELAVSSLRMSVRNIIPCVIESIHGGLSMNKVILRVCEGQYIRSSVTIESSQLLDLKEGKQVLALFKASAALVSTEEKVEPKTSVLSGQVCRLPQQNKGGEVTIKLPNGINVVGFVKPPHPLEIGKNAFAHIPESSVIIALIG